MSGPIESQIVSRLTSVFKPVHLDIVNESYKHNVPKGSESHFKLLIVSDAFEGQKLIQRHRLVNDAIKNANDVSLPVHALSISAKTPSEWNTGTQAIHDTPNCKGGSKL